MCPKCRGVDCMLYLYMDEADMEYYACNKCNRISVYDSVKEVTDYDETELYYE